MFEEFHAQLKAEAIAAYPKEAVWLITPGECRRVKNIADDPARTFRVDGRSMLAAQKRGLLAIVHSHPDYPACPSEADMRGQLDSGVPWGIVATDGESATEPTWWGADAPRLPLFAGGQVVQRGFVHGVYDCYALIRDYYRDALDIALPEFPRNWEWWRDGSGQDLYQRGFAQAGFRRIDAAEARPGDMWFAQIRSAVPSHAGVLLDNDLVLHHAAGRWPVDASRIAKREPLGRWHALITGWYRHEGNDG